LIGLALSLGLVPPEAASLVVAGAIVSIALNPLLFGLVDPLRRWALKRSARARQWELRDDPLAVLPESTSSAHLSGQVVLVGHGALGEAVAQALGSRPVVVIDRDRAVVESLRAQGRAAVLGDAAEAMTLVQAHIARAQWLVVALSDVRGVPPMLDLARQLNADLRCVVLAHTDEEAGWLRAAGVSDVLRSQTALAQALAGAVHAGPSAGQGAPHGA
jgi:CPA2 family monovalent cation:H+ antiporter-2